MLQILPANVIPCPNASSVQGPETLAGRWIRPRVDVILSPQKATGSKDLIEPCGTTGVTE
jgi:hypothetical protein